jgi:hypothetical protein
VPADTHTNTLQAMIHVQNLSKHFGELKAVDVVSFDVRAGEIFFLSGALFPLSNLPPALTVATRLDPLSYGVDGLRGALIGLTQIGLVTDVVVLSIVAAAFLVLGARAFARIQTLRSPVARGL